MKAIVYDGAVTCVDMDTPDLHDDSDAVVKVTLAGICGSDTHLLSGKVPGVRSGAVWGHEFVGEGAAAGPSAQRWAVGSRVVGSFLLACGQCAQCELRRFNFCQNRKGLGLGMLAGDIEGAQAEYVRVPNADLNLLGIPDDIDDERAIFCGDTLATAIYCVQRAALQTGATVAVLGAGPLGTLCALVAQHSGVDHVWVYDPNPARASFARDTFDLDASSEDLRTTLTAATGGLLADVVIDTAASAASLDAGLRCIRDGGRLVCLGAYGKETFHLPLGRAWVRGAELVFVGMGNVQGTWEEALEWVRRGDIDVKKLVTHRLPLSGAAEAYDAFTRGTALKALLVP